MLGWTSRIRGKAGTVDVVPYEFQSHARVSLGQLVQNVSDQELVAYSWIEELDLRDKRSARSYQSCENSRQSTR